MEATATKNRETRQHDGQSRPSYSGISGKAGESGAKPGGIAYPERPVSETKNGLTPESRESEFRTATETAFSRFGQKTIANRILKTAQQSSITGMMPKPFRTSDRRTATTKRNV
ncbi:hypothetical protein, partial [Alistipes ihumii]|uniref:hypothetical protein n=1 Tax=Alistipes ihumii TaxID=1470347 RepID=UPI003AB23B3F